MQKRIDPNSPFPARMREARLAKGLTHEKLAFELNVEHPCTWFWEHGRNFPRVNVLLKLATTLNVSLDWLFGLSDTQNLGQETTAAVGGEYGNEGL